MYLTVYVCVLHRSICKRSLLTYGRSLKVYKSGVFKGAYLSGLLMKRGDMRMNM
jgi:hypothetical protein